MITNPTSPSHGYVEFTFGEHWLLICFVLLRSASEFVNSENVKE